MPALRDAVQSFKTPCGWSSIAEQWEPALLGAPSRRTKLECSLEVSMYRIRSSAVLIIVAFALLILIPASRAQVFPGAGGGMAGPGAGMMGMGGAQMGPLLVVLAPSVQKELNLTEEQKTKVYSYVKEASQKHRDVMQAMAINSRANPQAMMGAGQQLQQLRQTTDKELAQILKPEQKERLDQIVLQHEGPLAVARPEIAAKLKLNENQQAFVQGVMMNMRSELGRAAAQSAQAGQFNPAQMREMATQLRKEAFKEIGKVIDRKQQKTFNSMLGQPFDMAKLESETSSAETTAGLSPNPAQAAGTAPATDAPATTSEPAKNSASPSATSKKGRARSGSGSGSGSNR
jgi:Spy/CpxP family protein refolding chaperone